MNTIIKLNYKIINNKVIVVNKYKNTDTLGQFRNKIALYCHFFSTVTMWAKSVTRAAYAPSLTRSCQIKCLI